MNIMFLNAYIFVFVFCHGQTKCHQFLLFKTLKKTNLFSNLEVQITLFILI